MRELEGDFESLSKLFYDFIIPDINWNPSFKNQSTLERSIEEKYETPNYLLLYFWLRNHADFRFIAMFLKDNCLYVTRFTVMSKIVLKYTH